jgi:hypothetical protein
MVMQTRTTCKEECHQKPWCILAIYTEYFVSIDFICPCSICLVKVICRHRCEDRKSLSGKVVIKIKEIQRDDRVKKGYSNLKF